VVEQDAITRIYAVGLAAVHCNPVGIELGDGIRTLRVEGSRFLLWNFLYETVKLTGACLIKSSFLLKPEKPDGFK
jgi:hypothetical protein